MAEKKAKKVAPKKRGPKPEQLKLSGPWESAVAKAVKRTQPKSDQDR